MDDLRECVDAAREQGIEQMQAIAHVYYAGNGGRSVTVDGDPSEASELLIVVKGAYEYMVGMATPSEMFSDDGTVFIPSGATNYSQGMKSGFRYSGGAVMCLQALNIKYIIGVNQY